MKAKSVTVTIAGAAAGKKIRRRSCKELQPSMIAASSNSRGVSSKLLRSKNMLNGNWMTAWTMARPRYVLARPSEAAIM
jgi:hypothetical protein